MNRSPVDFFGRRTLAVAMAALVLMSSFDVSQAAESDVYAEESARASKTLLLDVVRVGARLVAVGDRGHIIFSDDQGHAWSQAKVPTRQLITSEFFIDPKRGWS